MPSTRKQLKFLYNFSGDHIYKNSKTTPLNNRICDRLATNLLTDSLKNGLIVMFALFLSVCVPMYNIFINSNESDYDSQFVIPIVMPFIDPYTPNGFYINLTSQTFICMFGVFAIPTIEIMVCFFMNGVSVSAAVTSNQLTEFEHAIKNEDQFSAECIWKFRNIIVKIMDFDRFVWISSRKPISIC